MNKLIEFLKTKGLKESDYSFTKAGNLNFKIDGRQFQYSKTGYFRAKADPKNLRGAWKSRPYRVSSPYSSGRVAGYAWYLVFKEMKDDGWYYNPKYSETELIQKLSDSYIM